MSETSRQDHLAWCKRRALEYVDAGEPGLAVASMVSDLTKHPGTSAFAGDLGRLGIMHATLGGEGVRGWIKRMT